MYASSPSSSSLQRVSAHSAMRPVYAGVRAQLPCNLDEGHALDRELRADHAGAPLRVKQAPVPWMLADADARRRHRVAAWDQVHAAFSADLRRELCAEDGGLLLAQAWRCARLPARGEPITARHAQAANRLVELVGQMEEPPCDGSEASFSLARRRVALAVALHAHERAHSHPDDEWDLATPTSVLAPIAWGMLKAAPHMGVGRAVEVARLGRTQAQRPAI